MTAPLHLTGQVLAQRELDDYTVTPGVLGFVIFAALGVGVWLLLKSMTRQLNRVNFKERDAGDGGADGDGAGPDTAARDRGEDGGPGHGTPQDEVPAGYRREPTP